nr:hypothetical protein [Tanacetum cinerariifolium]
MKPVTAHSGLAYEGPSIPTNSSPEKVVERETEETTDKEQPNCQGSTAHIQPPVVPTPISEPDDKLFELAKVPLNENCSAMLLKKLSEKLGDPDKFLIPYRSITGPKGVAKDVFIKVGKFHFPNEFVVIDFEADPRVPLILRRSFLRNGRALIDVYGEEIALRVNDESVTFNLNQTMRYSSRYDDNSLNRIDVIDIACEEYAQDVLDFKYNSKSDNLTLVSNPSLSKETKRKFHFPIEFVVVDFEADPRVPLILRRSFLRNERALIDVYGEEIALRVNDESVTFNLNQTMRYSSRYDDNSLNRIDVIDIACEEYAQDVLDFKYNSKSDNLTLVSNPSLSKETKKETDKLPVIIAKDLKDDEKEALLKVLKSHKQAIA